MSTTQDATLKRGNGTDFDNIHLTTNWGQVEDKPSTYTPSIHTHDGADITKHPPFNVESYTNGIT